jgi:hypothetical protein
MSKNYQAIYQINFAGVWMDYAREGVMHPDDVMANIRMLERREDEKFRARVEDWSDKNRDPDIYYGDWDKSQLSPAVQDTAIFRDVAR